MQSKPLSRLHRQSLSKHGWFGDVFQEWEMPTIVSSTRKNARYAPFYGYSSLFTY
ncbi:hypothetical protein [uncultured Paraglaciecola sp.]|uniref:hypothetical protein n=1 Tax=uncultured Paraglaciecola sp. TaxID=1765024 RepID=UPI0025D48DA8|nr:hypothetical protein [uncultured Paraglaciecola sp.]